MNQKTLTIISKWVLVLSGLSWAYKSFTGVDVTATVFGGFEPIVAVVVGLSALNLAYVLVSKAKK